MGEKMAVTVKRRTSDIDVILDQEAAEHIVELGRRLNAASNSVVKVEGGNTRVRELAEEIERAKQAAETETLHLKLRALPYSKWLRVLVDNTPDKKKPYEQDLVGLLADAVCRMVVSARVGDAPIEGTDVASPESWKSLFDEMTDGQITIVRDAVMGLNTGVADPKAAFDLASRTLG